ncbi:peptidylprolyl isomerase [Nannocystaceae bacterium ST9]
MIKVLAPPALGVLASLLLGCGSAERQRAREARADAEASMDPTILAESEVGPASWGPRPPRGAASELIDAELARDPRHAGLARALSGEPGPTRTRALWSLARIGGEPARDRLLVELDRGDPNMLASLALLEVPTSEPGSPPTPEGEWARLEDALWTRYAVTDPSASTSARALVFAIARVGGPQSMQRFAIDLAEQPTRAHPPEYVARWTAGMQALGLLCARGYSLDEAGVAALVDGLEREDVEAARAAVYALGRCARSSGELLAESREAIVTRLAPFTERSGDLDEGHAALAWKALAALGDLPATIDPELLGPADPRAEGSLPGASLRWWVEVEAVRALAETREGRELLRARLAERRVDDFAGARQHVPIVALQAMRSGIATDGEAADAELVRIAKWLTAGRRSDDLRVRKASALALCELRLLQAIRRGTPELVQRCDRIEGAPEVELPPGHVAGLEVEALLRATRANDPGTGGKDLGTVALDDEAVIADQGEPPPEDPIRRARIGSLIAMAQHADPTRAAPALHALAEIDDARVAPVLRAALSAEDVGVLAAATTAIAVRSIDAGKRDLEVVPLLEALIDDHPEAGALEARLSAIEALGVLGHEALASLTPSAVGPAPAPVSEPVWLERTIVPLASAPEIALRRRAREALLGHPELLARFDALAEAGGERRAFPATLAQDVARLRDATPIGLRVHTSAGAFTIAFAGVEAPLNLANLIALAEDGYFDDLSFHRIVPGFVVQGGDPRGDGYGGPGWLVPCEWSNLRYERGTVGIALAGKDTGGSQFFVTQTAQPHLDGRYTVVGQVDEEGMSVVDQLLPGDRIVRVEVLAE